MRYRTLLQILLLGTISFMACNKDGALPAASCLELKEAMQLNDVSKANQVITLYIKNLASDSHTNENLQKLAALISSSQCSFSAEVVCFGCIYTLPAQSEIRIQFISGGTSISKVIDISNEPGDSKMKFVNMHD